MLNERKIDWKKPYVAYKFGLSGEEQIAARYQYFDAFAEAWGRTMYGGMANWCHFSTLEAHRPFQRGPGLLSRPQPLAGDMMCLQRYSDMGGIDAVFRQFQMGKRVVFEPYPEQKNTYDPYVWQIPKLCSFISHVFGKSDDRAFVEIFGERTRPALHGDEMVGRPHASLGRQLSNPAFVQSRSPYDTDCPPYFYNGGYEPLALVSRVCRLHQSAELDA